MDMRGSLRCRDIFLPKATVQARSAVLISKKGFVKIILVQYPYCSMVGTDFVRLFNRRTAVAIFVIISVLVVLVLQQVPTKQSKPSLTHQYPQLFLPLCLREVEKARAVVPERTGSPALVHLIAMVLPRMPCNQVQQSRGTGRITLARSCMNQRRKS